MTYRLPAEWAPQSAVQLTWPHAKTDWQPWLADIESVYLELVKLISLHQLVLIACHDETTKQRVTRLLSSSNQNLDQIRFFIAPCDDTWARDHGPITLTNDEQQLAICDFNFNAWGDKYSANLDDKITEQIIMQPFAQFDNYHKVDFVLEGGSIESDGKGCLLTTTRCLLNPNRNSDLNKDEIEQALKETLGMSKVLWLEHGYLSGDDTDAHIDTLARFAPEGIVYVACDDDSDPHYNELKKMEAELAEFTNVNGEKYPLFPLPWPKPVYNADGEPLPATYANYLIINDAVLVPVYNDVNDEKALEVIQQAHPGRKVYPVNCLTVIEQYGSLHCLTMQLPKGLII